MFLKNSIKGLYRTPFKSVFLVLLLGITTFIWELGMSTYVDIENHLDNCDDLYVTLGELEYVIPNQILELDEANYLNTALNSEMINTISQDNAVLFAEKSKEYFCNIENYKRTDTFTITKDEVVLVVTGIIYQEENNRYQARVKECLFAHKDMTGNTLLISAEEMNFDKGKDYVIHANLFSDVAMMPYLVPSTYDVLQSGKEIAMGYVLDEEEVVPNQYLELAEELRVKDNGIAICPTGNIESLHIFHQNILYIEKGRVFSEEEYENGEKVCILNDIVANRLEKEVGDEIQLSWTNGGVFGFWNSYCVESGFDFVEKYKIIGITNALNTESYKVFVPNNPELFKDGETMDGEVLRVIIDNRSAAGFVGKVRENQEDHYRFSIYDQGYAETVSAYLSVQNVAKIIVWSVSILCFATILLIAYISILKQKDASVTMLGFGTKRNQVVRYNVYSGTILGLFGMTIGTIAAIFSRERVFAWIEEIANKNFKIDFRFSDFNQSMQRKSIEFHLSTGMDLFLQFALLLFVALFLVVLVFSIQLSKTKVRGKQKIKSKQSLKIHYHRYLKGGNGFACKQIFRNKARSIGVIILGIAVAIFLGEILSASSLSSDNLEYLLQNEEIQGVMVNYNGNSAYNLLLGKEDMEKLMEIPSLVRVDGTNQESYLYLGKMLDKNGQPQIYEPLQIPPGFEGYSVVALQFLSAPNLVFTTSLDNTEEFYYVKEYKTTFLDGYDESFLSMAYAGELYGMISYTMADKNDIELGDTIAVSQFRPGAGAGGFLEYHIKVVGLFQSGFREENIYCPLDAILDVSFLSDGKDNFKEFAYGGRKQEYHVNNITIQFEGIQNISELKDQLVDIGLEEMMTAQSNRKYIVLDDGIALSNLNGLRMQDQYTRILMILMIVLCASANIFFSMVLVRGQKSKIGIMLSYGATKIQTYIAFGLDLFILYFVGNGIGILILNQFENVVKSSNIMILAMVGMCFIVGSSFTLFRITHGNLSLQMKNVDE